jgi:hydroxymethylbilane synthase
VGAQRIILGTRGSDLALAQACLAEAALREAWPDLEVGLEIIRTRGDEEAKPSAITDRKAGRKGMFTHEIEKALRAKRIDVAVHSAKDLPSEMDDELEIGATLPRASTDDVLITKTGAGLASLADSATVATGSIRRRRQLAWKRPDLRIENLRGNVPTRLRKLRENQNWSGIILARAGLERLGLEIEGEILSPEDFVPAGGQGVIALQARRGDEPAKRWLEAIDHEQTHLCLRAERQFLRRLNADCDCPVGVHAEVGKGGMTLRAQIFEDETAEPRTGKVTGGVSGEGAELLAEALFLLIYEL